MLMLHETPITMPHGSLLRNRPAAAAAVVLSLSSLSPITHLKASPLQFAQRSSSGSGEREGHERRHSSSGRWVVAKKSKKRSQGAKIVRSTSQSLCFI